MAFIKNLYSDEIRSGWLVSADIKKVWNRQLEMWAEVDRICRKHDITYWALYGTLLGAVRHKGFVPWDDDLDVGMLRPEYDRFCKVLEDELNGDFFEIKHKTFVLTKIVHSQTLALETNYGMGNDTPQGLAIDIYALDIAPDGTENSLLAFKALQEVMAAVTDFSNIRERTHVKEDGSLIMDFDALKKISELPFQERVAELYRYTYALWDQSSEVANYDEVLRKVYKANLKKSWLDETIYLPFETVELPAPKKFDEVLTSYYGDWKTPVPDNRSRLAFLHSADIPWREFCRLVDVKKILDDWNRKYNP